MRCNYLVGHFYPVPWFKESQYPQWELGLRVLAYKVYEICSQMSLVLLPLCGPLVSATASSLSNTSSTATLAEASNALDRYVF